MSRPRPLRVLALATFDSFLNASALVATAFAEAGCDVDYAILKVRRRQLAASQLARTALPKPPRWIANSELAGPLPYDVVLMSLDGHATRRVHAAMAAGARPRPWLVGFYPGLVLRYPYDGLAARAGNDFLWLNSPNDLALYRRMCDAFGVAAENARILGPPALLQRIERTPDPAAPVAFFEQTVIPRTPVERTYLADRLVTVARQHRQRPILVKPRITRGESTLHRTRAAIEPLLRKAARRGGGWPDNLSIVHAPARDLLTSIGHCLTITSTVAVEAVHNGIPTTVVSDFGAHDDLGTAFFFESGMLRRFAELDFDHPPTPEFGWCAGAYADPNTNIGPLVAEVVGCARERPPDRSVATSMRAPEVERVLSENPGAGLLASRAIGTLRRLF